MTNPVVTEMMSKKALLWRCLHGGPLTMDSMDKWGQDRSMPWIAFRTRNLPFLENLTDTYGACAVVARIGVIFVGHLRFYPKAVREMAERGVGMCLQQEFPYGPPQDFGHKALPPLKEIADKTLTVHCMMLAPSTSDGEGLRRRGIATQMARTLIDWATRNGWHATEATAYEALPIIYGTTGQTGRSFWENLGFRLVRTEREPALEVESEFVLKVREEALAAGLDPARLANRYVMRLSLGNEKSS